MTGSRASSRARARPAEGKGRGDYRGEGMGRPTPCTLEPLCATALVVFGSSGSRGATSGSGVGMGWGELLRLLGVSGGERARDGHRSCWPGPHVMRNPLQGVSGPALADLCSAIPVLHACELVARSENKRGPKRSGLRMLPRPPPLGDLGT